MAAIIGVKPPARLVAIVGGSGSGKTWLAEHLCHALGSDATRLSLDDFYRDLSHLAPARRERVNFDHPRAIDWAALEEVLRTCRPGRPARIPRYNFATHCRMGQETWRPARLVLLDGLWLLRRSALRRLFARRIFVEAPAALRLRRRIERDVEERGRKRASVVKQFREDVAPMHERFVAPQKRWADVVLRSPVSPSDVQELARDLRALLPTER